MKNSKPIIYLISSGKLTSQNYSANKQYLLKNFQVAIETGVSMIQIREKHLPVRLLFQLVSETVALKKNSSTRILVNDRADVALAAHADGVHLTSTSINTAIIRQTFPKKVTIGVSTHTIGEIKNAKCDGADFVVFSPIFPTPSKEKYGDPKGIGELKKAVKNVEDFPIIALGGINIDNFSDVINSGAGGIAAIQLFAETEKLAGTIAEIRNFTK